MGLIVYTKGADGTSQRLLDAVGSAGAELKIDVYRSIADLSSRIRKGKRDLSVAILCACTREELTEILNLHDLLSDLRLILILPDRESSTLVRGLALRPRFFSFPDADFKDVSAVLARMLKAYGQGFDAA